MCFGDIDDLFKLATPKYVYIRDHRLGMLKYSLMLLIFVYVVIYDVMYLCDHLEPHTANGYGSITMHHPVSNCNASSHWCTNQYKDIGDLKYCSQSSQSVSQNLSAPAARSLAQEGDTEEDGKATEKKPTSKAGPQVGDFITKPSTCRYLDKDRLTLEQTPNEIFIPMRYVAYSQEMSGDCYDPSIKGHSGNAVRKHSDKYFDCKQSWVTNSVQQFFVADIGDFTLSLQHSFMASDIGMSGVSTDYKGLFAACQTNHPGDLKTDCQRISVPSTNDTLLIAPEDKLDLVTPQDLGVHSLKETDEGMDQIKFLDLLKLSPIAQGHPSWNGEDISDRKLPDWFGHPESSIRESGGILMLSVSYDNTGYGRPGFPGLDMPSLWLGSVKPVTYSYRPYFIPTKTNKKVEVIHGSDSSTRVVNIWYGVTVKMSFEGKLVMFTLSKLLTAFTTGLVLLSSASTIVIYLALYVFKDKAKYLVQMYQYTEDMSDYRGMVSSGIQTETHYATGEILLDVNRRQAQGRALTQDETLSILTDYEIRLNRLDGRDPELAFITSDALSSENPVFPVHNANTNFARRFFNKFKPGGNTGVTPRSQQVY